MREVLVISDTTHQTEREKAISTRSLGQALLYGGATLGVAVVFERFFSFLSSLLAARVGGPQTFGVYALVLTTANTVATYAGAGIGATANRFSGQYPRESSDYGIFLRGICIIGISSALLSALIMFASAHLLARRLLNNESLTDILKAAALSSAMLVLLEFCRGLFIGQKKHMPCWCYQLFLALDFWSCSHLPQRSAPVR